MLVTDLDLIFRTSCLEFLIFSRATYRDHYLKESPFFKKTLLDPVNFMIKNAFDIFILSNNYPGMSHQQSLASFHFIFSQFCSQ